MAAQEPASSPEPRKKRRGLERSGEGGEKGPKRKKKGSGAKKAAAAAAGAPVAAGVPATTGERAGKVKKAAAPPLPRPPSPAWIRMMLEEFVKYLRSVRAEMKRVTWPSGKEVRLATVVVLITLVVVTGYIAIVNMLLNLIFQQNPTGVGM
ncbi:MAG: hypothetical protein AMXMBFR33_51780 [Candidatus Xenobia bacterium]|jgi:preprotein translocase subunit SecE